MGEIRAMGCDVLLRDVLQRGTPVLAICVGMQSLFEHSEENGGVDCLAWFKGRVRHFGTPLLDQQGRRLKVPHMGWNELRITREHPLWHGIADRTRFYFVHSFYVDAADRDIVVAQTEYGHRIDAAVARDNLFAAQFHPEKSQTSGLLLLKNFLAWDGRSH
jgi:glutamine amidotransferase